MSCTDAPNCLKQPDHIAYKYVEFRRGWWPEISFNEDLPGICHVDLRRWMDGDKWNAYVVAEKGTFLVALRRVT